ncbi:hypothetical protein L2E82_12109 [Cichorium intybus]|uniref:Uncharacterized protein n=1 Tax=Cichorium intybus TaxID=13427 RepID=A0ACB9GF35_CICIN|nr:hypothetical protein L2E82_12109 [Cichorium intybus]
MMESIDEESSSPNAVPTSSSIVINSAKHTTSIKRRSRYPRKEVNVSSSRVQETLDQDEIIVRKKEFSLDRKLNDQRVFNDVVSTSTFPADLIKTRKPSKSKKPKIRIRHPPERRDYHEGRVDGDHVESKCEVFHDTVGHSKTPLVPLNSTPIVNEGGQSGKVIDLRSCLSGRNVKGRRNRSALKEEPVEVEEYDEDMIKAAENLVMMRRGRRSKVKSSGNKKCLGFDLNKPPPTSPE